MNRNVSILIIILVILLIAGYLLVLRSRIQRTDSNITATPPVEEKLSPTPTATLGIVAASPSAIASPSGKINPTVKPTKVSTSSGSTTR